MGAGPCVNGRASEEEGVGGFNYLVEKRLSLIIAIKMISHLEP